MNPPERARRIRHVVTGDPAVGPFRGPPLGWEHDVAYGSEDAAIAAALASARHFSEDPKDAAFLYERGGFIIQLSNGRYTFTEPQFGTSESVTVFRYDPETNQSWGTLDTAMRVWSHDVGAKLVRNYHSHGRVFDPGYELFSRATAGDPSGDVPTMNWLRSVLGSQYRGGALVTPTGAIKIINVGDNDERTVRPGYIPPSSTAWPRTDSESAGQRVRSDASSARERRGGASSSGVDNGATGGAWGGRADARSYNPGANNPGTSDARSNSTSGPPESGAGRSVTASGSESAGPLMKIEGSTSVSRFGGGSVITTYATSAATGQLYAQTTFTNAAGQVVAQSNWEPVQGQASGGGSSTSSTSGESTGTGADEMDPTTGANTSGDDSGGEGTSNGGSDGDPNTEAVPEEDQTTDENYEFQAPGGKSDPDAPSSAGEEGNPFRYNPEFRQTIRELLTAQALSQAENPVGVGPGDPPPDVWAAFGRSDGGTPTNGLGASYGDSGALATRPGVTIGQGTRQGRSESLHRSLGARGMFVDNPWSQTGAGAPPVTSPGDPPPENLLLPMRGRVVESDSAGGLGANTTAKELVQRRIAPYARIARR